MSRVSVYRKIVQAASKKLPLKLTAKEVALLADVPFISSQVRDEDAREIVGEVEVVRCKNTISRKDILNNQISKRRHLYAIPAQWKPK